MTHSKCACGSDLVAVWDPVDEISRIKCDSPWHTSRERYPLESLLVGGQEAPAPMTLQEMLDGDPGPQPDVMVMSPAELKALYEHEEDD